MGTDGRHVKEWSLLAGTVVGLGDQQDQHVCLSQTLCSAISIHYSHLKFELFCKVLKIGDRHLL